MPSTSGSWSLERNWFGAIERRVAVVLVGERLDRVDVPVREPGHLVGQRVGGHRVVERPRQSVEHEAVAAFVQQRAEVGEPASAQELDRVLLGVGVEVTHDEDVVVAGRRRASSSAKSTRARPPAGCGRR